MRSIETRHMRAMVEFSQSWTTVLNTVRLLGELPGNTSPRFHSKSAAYSNLRGQARAAKGRSASCRRGRLRVLLERFAPWMWEPVPGIDFYRSVAAPVLQEGSSRET